MTHEIAGIALFSFNASGEMLLTWQEPAQMCEPGTWTLTELPPGPPNDQLELEA